MAINFKQSHSICAATGPFSFKRTEYKQADIEFDSDLGIEYLIKEIDQLAEAAVAFFKREMIAKPHFLWIRYSYSYDDTVKRGNWGKKTFCIFNPLYPELDINAKEGDLIRVDFAKRERL